MSSNSDILILILEDSEEDYELITHTLQKNNIEFNSIRVDTIEGFEDQIKFNPPDIIISDFNLTGLTGFEALKFLKDRKKEIPFLVVSGYIGEERAVEFLKSGATDYISKNRLDKLPVAINRTIKEIQLRIEKQQTQLLLQEEIERNQKLISAMSEGLVMLDERSHIIFTNKAFQQMTGYSENELVGKKWNLLLKEPFENSSLYGGMESRREAELLTKNHTSIWADISKSEIIEDNSRRIIKVIRDISSERINDQKLKELNSEMEQLMYRSSHDLRGPVSSIEGLIESMNLIEKDEELYTAFKEMVDEAYQILDSLALVTKFQHSPISVETIFIKPLAVELCEEVIKTMPNQITFNLEHKDVYTDKRAVRIILKNLIENCVKHGKPTNKTLNIHITTKSTENYIAISVEDNGQGINEKHQDQIFNMFYRANADVRSSGLGLYLSKKIAKRLGGDLYLNVGKSETGAKFVLLLPNPLLETEFNEHQPHHTNR